MSDPLNSGLPQRYEVPIRYYDKLDTADSSEKVNIVLELIEAHPEGKLELPERYQDMIIRRANLRNVALSQTDVARKYTQWRAFNSTADAPPWWGAQDSSLCLREAVLSGAQMQGAKLRRADLFEAKLIRTRLEGADLRNASLIGADMQGIFLRYADLRYSNLGGANLTDADLRDTQLAGVELEKADLTGADLRGAILEGVDLSKVASLKHIFISGAKFDKVTIQPEQLQDGLGEEKDGNYEQACRAYLMLKQNFSDIGEYNASSWAYRQERRMEKLHALAQARGAKVDHKWRNAVRNYWKAAGDAFVEQLCDYGEGVGKVLCWILLLLFIIGPLLFYSMGSFQLSSPENSSTPFRLWQQALGYLQALLYTFDVFTTASFSDLRPADDFTRLTSGVLAFVGIFLTGLLGFVAGNRIRRA